jgi:hypothetical protein
MKNRWQQRQPLFLVSKKMLIVLSIIYPTINHSKGWKCILYFFFSFTNKWIVWNRRKKTADRPLIISSEKKRRKEKKTIDWSCIKVNRWNDEGNYFMSSMTSMVYMDKYPRTCTFKRKKLVENDSDVCTEGNCMKWNEIFALQWVILYVLIRAYQLYNILNFSSFDLYRQCYSRTK